MKTEETEGAQNNSEATGTAPDSPSKQLPDHISFFSGNPSVEIIHGVMHLYKTKYVPHDFNLSRCCCASAQVTYFLSFFAAK